MPSKMRINYMSEALKEARKAARRGEVPVGATLVATNGSIIASDGNRTREMNDPTAHAEILVIRKGCYINGTERLNGCDLYVSLEPCTMCAAAISFVRIRRLYFGASDLKMGGVENGSRFFHQTTCHHIPEVYGGIQERQSRHLIKSFFLTRR
ncbi:MAG: tRNA-specific adenosine deaminase [Hyphomicrobiaceae bacterium hypho_1]